MKNPKSKKPTKQRNWLTKAPLHKKQKMLASTLSKELRKKYGRRALPIHKGDSVSVMRGDFRGISGEVTNVNLKSQKIYVEGITIKKADGTEVEKAIDCSNVMITNLFIEDKERRNILERKIKE